MERATCRGVETKEVGGRTRIAVVFTCPHCRQFFAVFGWADDPPPGDTAKCQHCGAEVIITNKLPE